MENVSVTSNTGMGLVIGHGDYNTEHCWIRTAALVRTKTYSTTEYILHCSKCKSKSKHAYDYCPHCGDCKLEDITDSMSYKMHELEQALDSIKKIVIELICKID